MARWEFKLPDIGEGVTEGEIVAWHVKPGDVVKEDAPMVEVMTDKATVMITSPRAGKISETRGAIGSVVAVHGVLVVFDVGAGEGQAHAESANGHANGNGASRAEPAATAVGDIKESLPGLSARSSSGAGAGGAAGASAGGTLQGYFNDKPLATPATRKFARDHDVDLRSVPPTGPQGRVTRQDVEAFTRGAPAAPPLAAAPAPSAEPAGPPVHALVKITPPSTAHGALEERVPFAGMRRKIAQKMAQSKHTAAHFTFVEECDVGKLKALRARMKPRAEAQGVKLSFLPFFVKAVVAGLKKHPILNSALDESTNEIVYRKYYNVGIAASTDAGLIVPVVKDADRRSLLDIAREIERLATDAKNGKSKALDLQGSTFTITSLGADGGLFATPIINFPEVAILGIHQIKQKPVVRDGQIVVGDVMLLSLSFDHRLVDGHIGAAFAYDVIRWLEDPESLFLEMA
jgi:pyruvate dehydrogenase E2 component (dihydrolipoamide acetyltransferase)